MNFDFEKLMSDPQFMLGLSLMSQWKTPPGQFPSLGAAMENYNALQNNQYTGQLRKMQMEKLEAEKKRQAKIDNLVKDIPNIRNKYTKPAQVQNVIEQASFESPPMLDSTGSLAGMMGGVSHGGQMTDYRPAQSINVPEQFDEPGFNNELRSLAYQAMPEKYL